MPIINRVDLVKGFSGVVDLVNTTLASHHLRVAHITDEICARLNIPQAWRHKTLIAAMLHDVGLIPLHDQADSLIFERDLQKHSDAGWLLLNTCPLTRDEGRIVRYHHTKREHFDRLPPEDRQAAELGNIICLADRIDMYARTRPGDLPGLRRVISAKPESLFGLENVEAALDLASVPGYFDSLTEAAQNLASPQAEELLLSDDDTTVYAQLFSYLIDARSPFTATHSSGVAHLGLLIHQLAGLNDQDRPAMFLAGLLHDIGKVGVPLEYLEKQGPLTPEEFAAVSRHAALSYQVLSSIPGFQRVAPWGSWHHERLDGRGYPNGLSAPDLPLESRIIAVADILTALTEDRPYRPGLNNSEAIAILKDKVAQGALDGDLVGLVGDHIEDISQVRRFSQTLASKFFRGLNQDIHDSVCVRGQGDPICT